MSDAFELEICQGKYRYRYEAGKQEVWRNGEPWEVMNGRLIGDKFVFSLAIELDEAIKERDALRSALSKQQALTAAAQHIAEVAQSRANQLQAKVTEMEQQEPVAWLHDDGRLVWREIAPHEINYADCKMAFYALPGAQPAPSVPDGWQLVPTAESRHPGIYKMLGALHIVDNTPGMSEWESYRAMLSEAPEVKP